MIQAKTVLSNIISGISLNLGIDKVTDLGGGRYEIECENTQYLNTDSKVTIDGVEYTVESFVLNTSLILVGDSAPTVGLKGLNVPTFVFGKYKAVNAQLARRQPTDYLPLIWMREILDRTEPPEEEESRYDSEGIIELYFCISSLWDDWETQDHYTEALEPLNNVVDAFIQALRASSMVGELGSVERINHAKLSTGTGDISGAQDRSVFSAYVSTIQVRVDMPIVANCGELPDTSCLPGLVKDQDGNTLGTVPSGGFLELNVGEGDVRNSDSSYTNSVASGDTLVLPDITVTDSDGSTSSVPSVQDVVCTPAADATVENSDASYTNTVASGGTLVLPDIEVTVNGASQGTFPSVQDVALTVAPTIDYEFSFTADDVVESGGAVSQLNDQSANGNDATQTNGAFQPTLTASDANYNNQPTITFAEDYFDFTDSVPIEIRKGFYFIYVGNFPTNTSLVDLLGRASYMVIQRSGTSYICWLECAITLCGVIQI